MSSLTYTEKAKLEKLFGMSSGYVANFNDTTFGHFFADIGVDIHSQKYCSAGTSKAKKLRQFWDIESDFLVGKALTALINHTEESLPSSSFADPDPETQKQIRRIEQSIESDPSLAIGTAKELVETCCKTILAERGRPVTGTPDMPALTKETLKELKLVPDGISDATRGSDVIKRLLNNLGTIGHGLAELRGLYGTGHGKHGKTSGLAPRHAKLAVGAGTTLATFLF